MKPHKKCIERSKKHCWCISDYTNESEELKEKLVKYLRNEMKKIKRFYFFLLLGTG